MLSQKRIIGIVLLMFFGVASFEGCSGLERKVSLFEPTLIGSWKLKGANNNPATTLTFRTDETFQIDIGGDGIVDIEGTYDLYENRLKLADTDSGGTIHCLHSGFYNYAIHGQELNFEVFAEECTARQEILTTAWESIPMIPKKHNNQS